MNLGEELWVCAIPDDGVISSPKVVAAVGGGLVAELVLADRIRLAEDSVSVVDPAPTGDALLDRVLAGAADERAASTRASWFIANTGKSALPEVAERVLAAGAATKLDGKRRRLWFDGPERLRPAGEGEACREAVRAVLAGERAPSARDAVLVGLISAAGLVGLHVDRDRRREAEARAEAIAGDSSVPAYVRDAIEGSRRAVATVINAA